MPHRVAPLLLLFLLLPLVAAAESEEAAEVEAGLLARHEGQLARLEELTESLAKSVHALESALARSAEPDTPPPATAAPGDCRAPQGVAITKRRPLWSERFHFAAAARLGGGAYAAAAAALPYEDADGITKYFTVGDSRGRVFISYNPPTPWPVHRPGPAPASSSHSRSMARSSRSRCPTRFGSMHDGGPSSSRSTDQETTIKVATNEVRVTVTSSDTTVERFLQDVHCQERKPLLVGLDTEWHKVDGGKTKTALMQICVGKRCLLFQVGLVGSIPDYLKRFLAHEDHVFVGVAIANDFLRLQEDYQIELSKTVELQAMVPFVIQDKGKWHKVPSLATLAQVLLDVVVENKGTKICYANWNNPRPTEAQIKYACTDAFVAYKIGDMLQSDQYNYDLHVSQSPVPDNSTDSEEDSEEDERVQRVQLCFVENQQTKKIYICPACSGRRRLGWTWNEALTHAVDQASSNCKSSEDKKRCHKRLLRNHGFHDDSGS